jgi:hypothetical protein
LENLPDHPVLHEQLELLRRAGRELASALNCSQVVLVDSASQKARREDVGRGYRVLDRQIYSDPADRGHRVGSVADA